MTRKKKVILTLLCTALVCAAVACLAFQYWDFIVLQRADYFALGPVGYAGELPREVGAYNRLLASPDAAQIFKTLAATGTNAAKAYAVAALLELDPDYAMALADKYQRQGIVFTEFSGCLIYTISFDYLVENIDLIDPGRSSSLIESLYHMP